MSNRILKESICTSADISPLSWFEEVLFYRLIVNCDDYGRFDGRIAVIKNRLFPLKENLTMKNVETAINKLARAGLVSLYEVDGRPYLFLPSWDRHQVIRAKKSKYPEPPLKAFEINCNQMISNENICVSNPIQSEYESEYESESKERDAPAHVREEKKPFGEFSNVFLTEAEHTALTERFGGNTEKLLNTFSCKLKAKGYTYDNHYATLILWAEEDGVGKGNDKSYDTDDFFEASLKRSYAEFDEKYGGTGS